MTLTNFQNRLFQPLYMDFLLYSEARVGFDEELQERIAVNLEELNNLLKEAGVSGNFESFHSCATKVYHIVRKVNQPLLLNALDELMTDFSPVPDQSLINEFVGISNEVLSQIREDLQ